MGLGSGIRDPGSGTRNKPIPDPGPGIKKAPDPGSGSATLPLILRNDWPRTSSLDRPKNEPSSKINKNMTG